MFVKISVTTNTSENSLALLELEIQWLPNQQTFPFTSLACPCFSVKILWWKSISYTRPLTQAWRSSKVAISQHKKAGTDPTQQKKK
jgi:hypothetical protein